MMDIGDYHVVWTSPSTSARGSMPLGNGDVGLNAWVEQDGDLRFYISKSDAWSENGRLLKVGRLRIALSPNPFRSGLPFRQELNLRKGQIEITAGGLGEMCKMCLWIDANDSVIRLEVESETNVQVRVSLELWRNHGRLIEGDELHSATGLAGGPPVLELPDIVFPGRKDRVIWCHHNSRSIWLDGMLLQGLGSLVSGQTDPLMGRTFGAAIYGSTFRCHDDYTLVSEQGKTHQMEARVSTLQVEHKEDWLAELERRLEIATEPRLAKLQHEKWWHQYAERAWIRVSGSTEADCVTQGWMLQRFMSGCAGRGTYPIKFNGSLFNVEMNEPFFDPDQSKGPIFNADYRRWGGAYWFQNTRLVYWPMLASGDFDLMMPFFKLYREALPLAEARTRIYFGHGGAFFPETMNFWGTYANSDYGWQREGLPPAHVINSYIHYYWQGGLELCALMLGFFAHTRDERFLEETLLPISGAVIQFYDEHHPRDEHGRLKLQPGQALEMWHEAINPAPDLAGLAHVLPRLLSLPAETITAEQRQRWERLLTEIPALPRRMDQSGELLAPAGECIGPARNLENPELYAIFPYQHYNQIRPDLELAERTFAARLIQKTGGWHQDAIQAACLGRTEEARRDVVANFSRPHCQSRFPAFWGPNADWVPDQDHGGVSVLGLQCMLMQSDGEKIMLFPAWPGHWDVDFKLHAPGATTVSGSLREGRLENLCVSPVSREKDIILMGQVERIPANEPSREVGSKLS